MKTLLNEIVDGVLGMVIGFISGFFLVTLILNLFTNIIPTYRIERLENLFFIVGILSLWFAMRRLKESLIIGDKIYFDKSMKPEKWAFIILLILSIGHLSIGVWLAITN